MKKDALLAKMKEKGIGKSEMAAKLGISRSAFYRKCNGFTEFTLEEIHKIMQILGLKTTNGIFF